MDSPDPKVKQDLEEDSPSISENSAELEPQPEHEAASQNPPQPQKRKGGRKPIYATSEERKQRNRQAQAAFRERRTEYIKQLEINLKQNEQLLQNLQENNRANSEECQALRYRSSLLERIILEKGYDVHAELSARSAASLQNYPAKTAGLPPKPGDPSLPPSSMAQPPRRPTVGLASRQDMQSELSREDVAAGQSPINGMAQAPSWQQYPPSASPMVMSPNVHQPPGLSSNGNSPDSRYPDGMHQPRSPSSRAQPQAPGHQRGPPAHATNYMNVVGHEGSHSGKLSPPFYPFNFVGLCSS